MKCKFPMIILLTLGLGGCEVLSPRPFLDERWAVPNAVSKAWMTSFRTTETEFKFIPIGGKYRVEIREFDHGNRPHFADLTVFNVGDEVIGQYQNLIDKKSIAEADLPDDAMWRLVRFQIRNQKVVGINFLDDSKFEEAWKRFAADRPACGGIMREPSTKGEWFEIPGTVYVAADQTCMHVFLAQAGNSIWANEDKSGGSPN